MTEVAEEKLLCYNCGSGVRENTAYCYNCGVPIANRPPEDELEPLPEEPELEKDETDVDRKTQEALDDLAAKLKFDEEEDKKLAKAAAERRRARVNQKKSVQEFAWEPADETPGALLPLVTLSIAIFAAIVVLFTVFWK